MSAGAAFTLLNPGPANVSAAVRDALADCVDQCHREPEYLDMQARVRAKLEAAFEVSDRYDAVLLTGSGTAALEAMVASTVQRGVVVLENGVYGERISAIAEAHGLSVSRVRSSWVEGPDLDAVSRAFEGGADTLAVVHHETTTGLLNDLDALAGVARSHGARFIVDSVSGLGGEAFDFDAIAPDAVCSTANKCVQGLPGIAFVFVAQGLALERRSVYLDLDTLRAKQLAGDTPFTPAIQVMAALEAALTELLEETVTGRIARYRAASASLRATLDAAGLSLLLPPALQSNTITCATLPPGVTYEQLHRGLREHGYVIYSGQGDLAKRAFRVANMGWIPDARLAAFGPALADVVAQCGAAPASISMDSGASKESTDSSASKEPSA